jgi:peptidoglycan/LPS O-acetylase OafA/YrhL
VNLQRRLEARDNNFDVLRLVAATLVLVSHCFPLTGHEEPFSALTGVTMGEVGVVMFFAMSGFLIAKSWIDEPHPGRYFLKRGLRLLPALAVAVAFTTLVIGPLFTTLPLSDYLTDVETWFYLVRASLLVTIAGQLPGVFDGNVYPEAVNGSLWTLPLEAGCYVMVCVLGLIGLLQRRAVLAAAAAVALLAISPLSPVSSSVAVTAGGNLTSVIELVSAFLVGALLYGMRDRLRITWLAPAALGLVWVVSWNSAWATVTTVLFLATFVIVFAFRTPASLRRLTAPGDVSYGIYVYAFPVQQSIASLWGPGLEPGVMLALAFPATYALALLSWRLVERPALRRKRYRGAGIAPSVVRSPSANGTLAVQSSAPAAADGSRQERSISPGRPGAKS